MPRLTPALVDRYLRLLGVPRRPPSLLALAEVTTAQLCRVPFENVSKLLRLRRLGLAALPDLQLHLDGIEQLHLGGTCYANNYHLYQLLCALGYSARLCGADMSSPDAHLVVVVSISGRDYLVDGGYAAPFLAPLPLDASAPQEIALGTDRYVLEPRDAAGCSRMILYRDGVERHGYQVKPAPRTIEEFASVIDNSFRPTSTFRNAVLLVRFWPGRSLTLHNLERIEVNGREVRRSALPDRAALAQEVERSFGIPRQVVTEAVEGIPELMDAFG